MFVHDDVLKWKIFRVTGPLCGEFIDHRWIPSQRPVSRSFDVYFDLRLNKRWSKQSWGWWFETSSRSLWRHYNDMIHDSCAARHYNDVIMTTMASKITSITVVYSTFYSDADQRKHQSSAPLAFVWGIHRDRWIPRTKCQLRGKRFHLMTSSWVPPKA